MLRRRRNTEQPCAERSHTFALLRRHGREFDLAHYFRFGGIVHRRDPGRPIDAHRCRRLQQMRGDFIGVKSTVTGRRILAQLEHETQRVDALRAGHGRGAVWAEHLPAKSPEQRQEIGYNGIAGRRAHHIPVHFPARGDLPGGSQHVGPGGRGGHQIAAIEKHLGVAHVGKRIVCAVLAAHFEAALQEIRIRRLGAQWGQRSVLRQAREPGIVDHDRVVRAGAAREVQQFLLEEIGVRQVDNLDLQRLHGAEFPGRRLQRIPFHARVDCDHQRRRRASTAHQEDDAE